MTVLANSLLDAHSNRYSNDLAQIQSECSSVLGRTEIYLDEDVLEEWIQMEIEHTEWTKGKLKCPKCTANVGSFDFVAGLKCDCKQFNQPSIHFIRSKIDLEYPK